MKIFAEITNPTHGGHGWEFGSCLWSPVKNKIGANTWKIMTQVSPGDLIIHFLKQKQRYYWVGISYAASQSQVRPEEPPSAGVWKGYGDYYYIPLKQYTPLKNIIPVNDILSYNPKVLLNLLNNAENGQFCTWSRTQGFRLSERYLAPVTNSIFLFLKEIAQQEPIPSEIISEVISPTLSEPIQIDASIPSRIEVVTSRVIRDSKISRQNKYNNNYFCQICGQRIVLPNGNFYAEAHHLQPLSGNHCGPDIPENLITLCPNHHAEFDYGSISINPKTKSIEHIDKTNPYHNKKCSYPIEHATVHFLEYHYNKVFISKKF